MKRLSIVLIFLILFLIGLSYYTSEQSTRSPDDNAEVEGTKSVEPTITVEEYSKKIIDNQEPILKLYTDLDLEQDRKVAIFFDLMTPLGALDPIATDSGNIPVKDIVNFIYGNYARKMGLSKIQAMALADRSIQYGMAEFDYQKYFEENKEEIKQLTEEIMSDENLEVIGYWAPGMYRFNKYFGDEDKDFYWNQSTDDEGYFTYDYINEEITNAPDEDVRVGYMQKYHDIFGKLIDLDIYTVYKCNDRLIFIHGGTTNNALGYIYNADSAEEVNCGLLTDRFRISKDEKLNGEWRYWIGK